MEVTAFDIRSRPGAHHKWRHTCLFMLDEATVCGCGYRNRGRTPENRNVPFCGEHLRQFSRKSGVAGKRLFPIYADFEEPQS